MELKDYSYTVKKIVILKTKHKSKDLKSCPSWSWYPYLQCLSVLLCDDFQPLHISLYGPLPRLVPSPQDSTFQAWLLHGTESVDFSIISSGQNNHNKERILHPTKEGRSPWKPTSLKLSHQLLRQLLWLRTQTGSPPLHLLKSQNVFILPSLICSPSLSNLSPDNNIHNFYSLAVTSHKMWQEVVFLVFYQHSSAQKFLHCNH